MITVTNTSHRAKRLPLERGGFLVVAPGATETAPFRLFGADLGALEGGGLVIEGGAAVKVRNNHDVALPLPVGGPVLKPGVATKVERWSIIKGHPVVKAWLAAKAIEALEDGNAPDLAPERLPVAPPVEPDPEPAPEPEPVDIGELRAQFEELTGEKPDGRWGEDRLRQAIDAKLAE